MLPQTKTTNRVVVAIGSAIVTVALWTNFGSDGCDAGVDEFSVDFAGEDATSVDAPVETDTPINDVDAEKVVDDEGSAEAPSEGSGEDVLPEGSGEGSGDAPAEP